MFSSSEKSNYISCMVLQKLDFIANLKDNKISDNKWTVISNLITMFHFFLAFGVFCFFYLFIFILILWYYY